MVDLDNCLTSFENGRLFKSIVQALYLTLLHLFRGSLLHLVEPKWILLNNKECVRECVVNISFQPNMPLCLLIMSNCQLGMP